MRTGRQCRGLGWDHPRVGGEKVSDGESVNRYEGSPPHGRGKAFSVLRRQFRFRITPAHAGKSRARKAAEAVRRDHPRVGGEKLAMILVACTMLGSPPRRRGKVEVRQYGGWVPRITPAWTGKRFWNRPWVWATSDHPRVGGEKAVWKNACRCTMGSPPRGRGKAGSGHCNRAIRRITPA